tara:strand:- start:424 stop:1482 length:1059 start_codon:yes stop_codon:yes gene_type:complete
MSDKDNKYGFDLTTPADDIDYDPLASSSSISANITAIKNTKSRKKIDYQAVTKDFVKVERNILDVVVPFVMDRYSSGTALLYIMLYRLTYGFRKNKLYVNDDELAKRTGIKKRTLFKYRDELEECDLIQYERGYKTTKKPCYVILLPNQSKAFTNILHKNTNILHKTVKSLYNSNTIYNFIDKHSVDIETIVRDFYARIGKTQKRLTLRMLNDGIKVVNDLISQQYTLDDIKNCIEFTFNQRDDIYSINYLNYSMGDYLADKENEDNRKRVQAAELKKLNERQKKVALENQLEREFEMLPMNVQNTLRNEAEEIASEYIKKNNIKWGEKMIVSSCLNELLMVRFKKIVKSNN